MNFLDSLLDAIERFRGDALVMHVGEKPYVVTTFGAIDQFRGPLDWGQVELPSRALTLEALTETLGRILSIDQRAALDAYGAIKFDVTSATNPAQRFAIVAARGGGDIWLEVRRLPRAASPAESGFELEGDTGRGTKTQAGAEESLLDTAFATEAPPEVVPAKVPTPRDGGIQPSSDGRPSQMPITDALGSEEEVTLADREFPSEQLLTSDSEWFDDVMTELDLNELLSASAAPADTDAASPSQTRRAGDASTRAPLASAPTTEPAADTVVSQEAESAPVPALPTAAAESTVARVAAQSDHDHEVTRSRPALVVPLARHSRTEGPTEIRGGLSTLERILRLAAERGAAGVYVVAQSPPLVRIDDEISALDGEPVFTVASVERLAAAIAPHSRDDSAPPSPEWTIDIAELGRVRCMLFRDHRGPGLTFRMIAQRAISVDQLALPAEVQALCSEADGLIVVAGGRGTGKSTLITSLVDLINRTRSDHVITIETQIDFVHSNKRAFISQREIRGDADAMAAAMRAASREDPDVIVVEELRTVDLTTMALEAAQAGRLVLASIQAPSTVSAIERIIEMFPPERREKTQSLLAGTLRAVVSQVLLRRLKGGLVVARELLFNTTSVADLLQEGKTFQLPAVLEGGRAVGMTSMAESLATLVRQGTVHPSHAYRKAPNREQFLALLRRDGVDTSITERLA